MRKVDPAESVALMSRVPFSSERALTSSSSRRFRKEPRAKMFLRVPVTRFSVSSFSLKLARRKSSITVLREISQGVNESSFGAETSILMTPSSRGEKSLSIQFFGSAST